MTLEATLNLVHAGKTQVLVNEVANEVNRIVLARGERLRYSAETIGHRLKKVGLITRRLGREGKGLVIDSATMACVHELAGVYGGAGMEPSESTCTAPCVLKVNDLCRLCRLCTILGRNSKDLMRSSRIEYAFTLWGVNFRDRRSKFHLMVHPQSRLKKSHSTGCVTPQRGCLTVTPHTTTAVKPRCLWGGCSVGSVAMRSS